MLKYNCAKMHFKSSFHTDCYHDDLESYLINGRFPGGCVCLTDFDPVPMIASPSLDDCKPLQLNDISVRHLLMSKWACPEFRTSFPWAGLITLTGGRRWQTLETKAERWRSGLPSPHRRQPTPQSRRKTQSAKERISSAIR